MRESGAAHDARSLICFSPGALRWSRNHSFTREIAARFDDLGVSPTNMVMASPNAPQQTFLTRSNDEIFAPRRSAWPQVIAIPLSIRTTKSRLSIYSEIATQRQFDHLGNASERHARAHMENANVRTMSVVLMQPQCANRAYRRTANFPTVWGHELSAPTFAGRSPAGSHRAGDEFLLENELGLA